MLFYGLIIIILLLLIYIPSNKVSTSFNQKIFNIKRDILANTNDLAKFFILK